MRSVSQKPTAKLPVSGLDSDLDVPGCYAIFDRRRCLYVGATWRSIRLRVMQFCKKSRRSNLRVWVWALAYSPFELERVLIHDLKPSMNRRRPERVRMAKYRGAPCVVVGREGNGRVRIEFLDAPVSYFKTVMEADLS